jgi:hypothetical protein
MDKGKRKKEERAEPTAGRRRRLALAAAALSSFLSHILAKSRLYDFAELASETGGGTWQLLMSN